MCQDFCVNFGGGLTETTLRPLRVGTIQITIIAANKALKCIFIRKLLFDLGLMLQTFVAPLNHICSVNAFSDRLRKFVKRIQTFLGTFEDPYCECIWQPYVKDEPGIADALLPETVV